MTGDLVGLTCHTLVLQEFWLGAKLVTEVNVLHFKATCGRCFGIYFDDEDCSWEVMPEGSLPACQALGDDEYRYPLIDLTLRYSLVGKRVTFCQQERTAEEVILAIGFACSGRLVLRHSFSDETQRIERQPE
jgi:hypothetical protein